MFCKECGEKISDNAAICMKCGVATGITVPDANPTVMEISRKNRTTYVVLALFLGCFGVHNFYAGYTGKGIAQLLITLLIGWLLVPLLAIAVWVIIEMCSVTADAKGNAFI